MIRACSSVDLPDPVLPAISTCCDVPLPQFQCESVRRSGLAQGHVDSRPAVDSTIRACLGSDKRKRDLHAARLLGLSATPPE